MRKVESVKIIGPSLPDDLAGDYLAWMKTMCAERERNVAVGSVPFYTDIISRSLMPVDKGKFSLAVFFYDYILQANEKGGPSHHPDEAEGASAIGPELRRDSNRKRKS